MDTTIDDISHDGELRMRQRLPGPIAWDGQKLRQMVRRRLTPAMAAFIEAQPFFFVATADASGNCDASFRGREHTVSGEALPAIKVLDDTHLMFPDFSGNGLYNSLGNMAVNPHIGMLFVDFENQRRVRINGGAEIVPATADIRRIWPLAQAAIAVTVEQAFGNCQARIPRLTVIPGSDHDY